MSNSSEYLSPQKLSVDLKRWANKNGYRHVNLLGKELFIPKPTWSHIAAGNGIVATEFYARVHYRTGLVEADPRTVPPRAVKLPKGGETQIKRAWTIGEWDKWLKEEGPKYQISKATPPREVRETIPKHRLLDSPLPDKTKSMADAVLEQLADLVADKLDQRAQDAKKAEPSKDIGFLATALHKALVETKEGTIEDHTLVHRKYGVLLARLLPLIDAYIQPTMEKREQALERPMEV